MLYEQSEYDRGGCRDGARSRRSLLRGRVPLAQSAFFLAAISIAAIGVEPAFAEPTVEAEPPIPVGSSLQSPQEARRTVQSLIDFALGLAPRSYSSDKHWDKRKKVWAGVELHREGLRLKTKRRWRDVRHGRWTRYEVTFPGDESKPPPVNATVREVLPKTDPEGQVTWVIKSHLTTPLDFSARIERWNLGAKWYTFTVTGHMRVSLTLTSTLTTGLDYSELPPAMVIDLKVSAAQLTLDEFHVDRISKVGGEVAEQWGKIAEKVANEILIEDYNEKIVSKLNRSIEKHRNDLRFSPTDWWRKLEGEDE
ncbi:MAG: hypothetical protein AAFU85_34420 [Planctomycetota bacterium]